MDELAGLSAVIVFFAADTTPYVAIILFGLVIIITAAILASVFRRARKEVSIVGFSAKAKPKDEKIAGYSLLLTGIGVMLFSVYQVVILLTGNVTLPKPFVFSTISSLGNNSGQAIGTIFYAVFWLLILWSGGRKIAVLGLDLLRGMRVKLKLSSRIIEAAGEAEPKSTVETAEGS